MVNLRCAGLFFILLVYSLISAAQANAWPCAKQIKTPSLNDPDTYLAYPADKTCPYMILIILQESDIDIAYPQTIKSWGIIHNPSLNTDWFNNEELIMIKDNDWVNMPGSIQTFRFPVYEHNHPDYVALSSSLFTAEQYYVVLHAPLKTGIVDIYLHDVDYVKFINSPLIAVPPAL